MMESQFTCKECGASATVHISNMVQGERVMLHLCMDCADIRAESNDRRRPRGRLRFTRPEVGAILVAIGIFIFFVSALADALQFGGSEGFGWKQNSGLILAAVLVLVGSLFGALFLAVIGMGIGMLTILADLLHFGSVPGFGIQQILGTMLGAATMIGGLRLMRSTSRSPDLATRTPAQDEPDDHPGTSPA